MFAQYLALPPLAWKSALDDIPAAGVVAALAGVVAPGSLKYPRY